MKPPEPQTRAKRNLAIVSGALRIFAGVCEIFVALTTPIKDAA